MAEDSCPLTTKLEQFAKGQLHFAILKCQIGMSSA
jgi:hypothetical protein